jgi:hypothetical protein
VGVLVICTLYSEVLCTLTEVFPCFFLSHKASARVKLAKTVHGLHSSRLLVICVVLLLFVLFYVLLVCKCVQYYCHQVTTQLQLIVSYHISYIVSYHIICQLYSKVSRFMATNFRQGRGDRSVKLVRAQSQTSCLTCGPFQVWVWGEM